MKLGTEECKYRYVYLIKDENLNWLTNSGTWSTRIAEAYITDDITSARLIVMLNMDRPVRLGGRVDATAEQMIEITTDKWTALVQKHRDHKGRDTFTFWDLRFRNREVHLLDSKSLIATVRGLEGWDEVDVCSRVSI